MRASTYIRSDQQEQQGQHGQQVKQEQQGQQEQNVLHNPHGVTHMVKDTLITSVIFTVVMLVVGGIITLIWTLAFATTLIIKAWLIGMAVIVLSAVVNARTQRKNQHTA